MLVRADSCFLNLWKKRHLLSLISRHYSNNIDRRRVCIVGSGPAGFYTAQQLLKDNLIEIDIYEKLPVPFGLMRYGVAPDHPEIKNVTNTFTKTALHERCNFYGNINVGEDVKISELLDTYHGVVLAFGASCDKHIGIPGEDSRNVLPARKFVGWYTGHPDFINESINLDTETAVVVGNGNVAIDVARVLLRSLNDLKATDIADYAYESLKKSRIKKVIMVGRRGPLQAAFTIKEFREMTTLKDCRVEVPSDILTRILNDRDNGFLKLERPKIRLLDLMRDIKDGKFGLSPESGGRCFEVKFLRSPKRIIPGNEGQVEKFLFNVMQVKDANYSEFTVTDEEEVLECGLVLRSVGYNSFPIDPIIPFDKDKHIIRNTKGKVNDVKGLYCSGWVKTGPIGVIASTMYGSFETAEILMDDLTNGELDHNLPKGKEDLFKLLENRGVKYVTFQDWENIDKYELDIGREMGKSREKIYQVRDMLKIAHP